MQRLSLSRFFRLGLLGFVLALSAETAEAARPLICVEDGNGKAYFFRGGHYSQYDIAADQTDAGYPKAINNRTWPGVWPDGIDAAVNNGQGKFYFFKGPQYLRYDIATDRTDAGYPKPINNQTWPGLPWTGGIDAVVNLGNGKLYFFKDDEYLRYDVANDAADAGYPQPFNNQSFPGMPWKGGIDSAANFGNGKAYLFRGGAYLRFDLGTVRTDAGYPQNIDDQSWPGIEALMRAHGGVARATP